MLKSWPCDFARLFYGVTMKKIGEYSKPAQYGIFFIIFITFLLLTFGVGAIYESVTKLEVRTFKELGLKDKKWSEDEVKLAAESTYGRLVSVYQPVFEEAAKSGSLGAFYALDTDSFYEMGAWYNQDKRLRAKYNNCELAYENLLNILSKSTLDPYWSYYQYNVQMCGKSI